MPRQSAAVYRRRRIAVAVLLIVVAAALAAGIWLAVAQPWQSAPSPAPTSSASKPAPGDSPTPDDSPSPDESPTPAPTDSPDATETPGIAACAASDIVVAAETDADTYAADVLPELSISLTNTGTRDCTMNVGSSTQKFTVSSGSDVWWRSTDCQTDPSDMIVTLTAGKTVRSATPVVWDRTRSSVDTCEAKNRPRAPGGGASYHVKVSIGGFDSERSKQFILR